MPNIQTAKAITEEYSEPIVETVTDRKPVETTKPEVKEEEEVKEEKSSLEQADVNGSVKVENSEASPKKENKQYKK